MVSRHPGSREYWVKPTSRCRLDRPPTTMRNRLFEAANPKPGAVRFGSHARELQLNGWRSIIPARGKIPLIENWPSFGAAPPDSHRLKIWRATYPASNIGLVLDDQTVAIDADISAENFSPPNTTQAKTLAHKVANLADTILGKTPFIRVGREPKWMRLYAAADTVPTMAGGPIEVFCTAGSKQVLLYGRHPDTNFLTIAGSAKLRR